MRKVLCATTSFALAILASAAAEAAPVINTATLPNGLEGSSHYYCSATNVGNKPATNVTVEIIDSASGSVLSTNSLATLQPSRFASLQTPVTLPAFCRVTGLSKKAGTVVFFVYDSSTVEALVTVTAP